MSVTITSVTIDDDGEQAIIILAGVSTPLTGSTPTFLFHRTPSGLNLSQDQVVINSDTKITINGLKNGANNLFIREGETVTMDYVSGLLGNSVAIPAINGTGAVNNSTRQPRIDSGQKFRLDENTPTTGNLTGPQGHVRVYDSTSYTAGTRSMIAKSDIRGGKWQEPMDLPVGSYTLDYYNIDNKITQTKTITV